MDDGDAVAAVDESGSVEHPEETQVSCDAWHSYDLDGVEPQAAAVNTQHIG